MPDNPTCYYRSNGAMRSRSVGSAVLSGVVDLPALPPRLLADWDRELRLHLDLGPGDVEALPLVRARARWPGYRLCVQAATDWTHGLGLPDVLAASPVALMACRGARYHHDGVQYGSSAFCNLFLSEDKGLDLHFPFTGERIALRRGVAVVFDTGQPHGVIPRGRAGFVVEDFPQERDCLQAFLTWEIPIEQAAVAQALQVRFDTDPSTARRLEGEKIEGEVSGQDWRGGAPGDVCPQTGQWCSGDMPQGW